MASTQKETEQVNIHSFTHIEQYEQRIDSGFEQIKAYIIKEPGIVLTVLYLSISTIGISYLAFVLLGFNINVLPHVELTDFVLSAIHYTMTLAVFLGFFLFTALVFKTEALARKKWLLYRRILNKYHQKHSHQNPTLYFSLVVVIYLFVSASVQSVFTVKALKADQRQQFNIELNQPVYLEGKQLKNLVKVQVIADLSKHLWLYQSGTGQVFMVNHENLLLLSPIAEPLPEKVEPEKVLNNNSALAESKNTKDSRNGK